MVFTPWDRGGVQMHLRELAHAGWGIRHIRTQQHWSADAIIGILGADRQLVMPGISVAQMHQRQGRPLRHPSWPTVYCRRRHRHGTERMEKMGQKWIAPMEGIEFACGLDSHRKF